MSSSGMPKSNKMLQYLNWRVRVTIHDTRYLVGTFIAFDKHMNMILADTEEFRIIIPKGGRGSSSKAQKLAKESSKTQRRVLGLIVLRGDNVISMTPESPPVSQPKNVAPASQGGPGLGRPMGRGIPASTLSAPPPMMPRGFPPQGSGMRLPPGIPNRRS